MNVTTSAVAAPPPPVGVVGAHEAGSGPTTGVASGAAAATPALTSGGLPAAAAMTAPVGTGSGSGRPSTWSQIAPPASAPATKAASAVRSEWVLDAVYANARPSDFDAKTGLPIVRVGFGVGRKGCNGFTADVKTRAVVVCRKKVNAACHCPSGPKCAECCRETWVTDARNAVDDGDDDGAEWSCKAHGGTAVPDESMRAAVERWAANRPQLSSAALLAAAESSPKRRQPRAAAMVATAELAATAKYEAAEKGADDDTGFGSAGDSGSEGSGDGGGSIGSEPRSAADVDEVRAVLTAAGVPLPGSARAVSAAAPTKAGPTPRSANQHKEVDADSSPEPLRRAEEHRYVAGEAKRRSTARAPAAPAARSTPTTSPLAAIGASGSGSAGKPAAAVPDASALSQVVAEKRKGRRHRHRRSRSRSSSSSSSSTGSSSDSTYVYGRYPRRPSRREVGSVTDDVSDAATASSAAAKLSNRLGDRVARESWRQAQMVDQARGRPGTRYDQCRDYFSDASLQLKHQQSSDRKALAVRLTSLLELVQFMAATSGPAVPHTAAIRIVADVLLREVMILRKSRFGGPAVDDDAVLAMSVAGLTHSRRTTKELKRLRESHATAGAAADGGARATAGVFSAPHPTQKGGGRGRGRGGGGGGGAAALAPGGAAGAESATAAAPLNG